MRMKPFLQRMADTQPLIVGAVNPTIKVCEWCKEEFEMLSSEWKYKRKKKNSNSEYVFCRYKHMRLWDEKYNPKPELRGEYFCKTEDRKSEQIKHLTAYINAKKGIKNV